MKKITLKVIGTICLILALVITQVPAPNVFANTDGSDAFEMDGTTLVKYTGTAKTVSVSDTVKVIGEEAFAGNTFVKEIKLPASVEEISYRAFADCSALEKISLSDNLVSVSSGACSNCTSLNVFYMGDNLRELGYGVFAGCDSLGTITLSENNTYFMYKDGLLYDDEGKILYCVLKGANLTSVSLPRTVEEIMPYAFWGCDTIEALGLSEFIDELDDYSLCNMKNLRSVVVPYSVKKIGLKAFADCIRLRDITIHPTVKSIHETAFDGCLSLNVIAEPGSVADKYFQDKTFQPVTEEEYEDLEDKIYSIGDDVLSLEDLLTGKVENPNQDNSNVLGSTVVSSGQAVILIDNTKQVVNKGTISNKSETENTDDETVTEQTGSEVIDLFSTTDIKGNTIPKYTIVDGVIATRAYYGSKKMDNYSIPQNITEIGEFSFARSNIKNVSIPNGVTKIGYAAFYHCDNLKQVSIPSSVTEISPFAFDNTKWLENWKKTGQEFLIVGDGILLAYNGGNSHVTIPDSVKKIAPYAFYKHNGLLSVSLPDSLVEIGEAAFCGCTNLEDVYGGTNLKTVKDRAFYECPLQTVKIPDTLESIGLLAYDLSDNRDAKDKTAIFYGDIIPKLGYEEASTRLSNDWYRDYALKDVLFAVVNPDVEQFENTVLDDKNCGFNGLVVSVISEENATVELRHSDLSKEEAAALGVTNKVSVFQKTYTISNFDEFFTANKIESSGENENSSQGITVINKSEKLPVSYHYDAKGELLDGAYTVTIQDLADAKAVTSFKNQYKKLYGEEIPENTCYLDLSLFETDNQIPITNLGKMSLTVSIPLNENMQSGTLHVVCLDNDGQLEEVPYAIAESGKEKIAQIQVEHFSPYAIYSYSSNRYVSQAVVKDGEAVFTLDSAKLDESPDTGDYINPKWILVAGLASVGIILLLWKKKK